MTSTGKIGLLLFVILTSFVTPVLLFAQFKVEPKVDPFAFTEEKTVEYYFPTRFTRVEGWFPAFGVTLRPKKAPGLSFSADIGYGISNQKTRFDVKSEYKLPVWEILKLGARGFDNTTTNDEWIISSLENSFAVFLLHEDFHDYFRTKGFSVWGEKQFEDWLHLRLEFWSARYESMMNEAEWTLFGRNKTFRENPAVTSGRENKLRFEFIIDRLDNPIFPLEGWYLEGAIEQGGEFLGGDFDQTGVFLTGKYFQRSFVNQRMIFQMRYGHRSNDTFAQQHLLDLGGIGTLRGYRFKEFRDRHNLIVGTWQYYFNGDILQKIPLQWIPFYSSLGLVLFAETGALWENKYAHPADIQVIDKPQWKSDVGFSLSLTGDFVRVDFTKRLDRSKDTWAITVRILPKW